MKGDLQKLDKAKGASMVIAGNDILTTYELNEDMPARSGLVSIVLLGRCVLSRNVSQKVFDYIALLESTNDQLLATLKKCVTLLAQFTPLGSDPKGLAGDAGRVPGDHQGW